uniref:Integrase catalytic domain-containing protein n=1 Tax=Tanacetum cinerariifolium TaxID=118510 RepID=A0A699GGY3_TANCI|nr:hypothetical protein [Tanacetum cinerariifolium]
MITERFSNTTQKPLTSMISKVYYVEGIGYNLFSVGQFCDLDLEVAFKKHSCYVRDVDGVELLKDLVRVLPRLKFEKDYICSACKLKKSKKSTHKPKSKNTIMKVLHTLHMDLCGPMRVQSINGKRYILVIVDDYSRFTSVKFLRSKDETSKFVTKFLKQIQVGLNKTVRSIRTDNGTEFVNQVLTEFYEEAIAIACYTQNRSLIHTRHNKTSYELVHGKKPDITFLYVFGALCYPINDSKDLGKLKAKADIEVFVGYAPNRKGYRTYNKRTRHIMETIHVQFDEMTEHIAPMHISSGPEPILMTHGQISLGLVLNHVPAAPYVPLTNKDLVILFQPIFNEYFEPPVLKDRYLLILQFKF